MTGGDNAQATFHGLGRPPMVTADVPVSPRPRGSPGSVCKPTPQAPSHMDGQDQLVRRQVSGPQNRQRRKIRHVCLDWSKSGPPIWFLGAYLESQDPYGAAGAD